MGATARLEESREETPARTHGEEQKQGGRPRAWQSALPQQRPLPWAPKAPDEMPACKGAVGPGSRLQARCHCPHAGSGRSPVRPRGLPPRTSRVPGRREGCHRAPLFLACARPPACPPSQPWCAARRRHRGLLLCRLSGCVLTPQGEALNLPPSSPPSPRGDRGCGQDPSWRPHRPQATAVSEAAGPRGWVCGPGFTTVQAAWLTTCPLTRGGQELPAHIPARALHWWERRRDRQARTRSPGQSGGERLLHLPSRPKRTG